jgi:hypothetical protein
MTLREVTEQIISSIGAAPSLGMKWNPLQIEDLIPSLRVEAIKDIYNGSRMRGASPRINGAWTQKFNVTIDSTIQDSSLPYLIANVPAPAPISKNQNGFIYVGAKNFLTPFYQAQSRDEIITLNRRGFINNGKQIVYLYADNQLEIYGNKSLKDFTIQAVLAKPQDSPNFDIETDDYPLNDELLITIIDMFKRLNNISIATPKDTVADGADNTTTRVISQNII